MKEGSRWFLLVSILFLCVWTPSKASRATADSASVSECVKCHTNVKGLIRLGWKIEEIKGKPSVSEEIEGEG